MKNMPITNRPLAAIRELLPAQEIDGLLVSGPENRRYLSGFTADDPYWGMLLITPEAAVLLTDFRYQIWAQQEAPDFRMVIYSRAWGKTWRSSSKNTGWPAWASKRCSFTYRQYQP